MRAAARRTPPRSSSPRPSCAREHTPHPISKGWQRLLGATIAYGYKPGQALIWSVGVILLGCLVFWNAYAAGVMSPTGSDAYLPDTQQLSEDYPAFCALMYSVDTFVPIVNFHQADYWLPNANRMAELQFGSGTVPGGALARVYLWIHTALGWVLTTLAVAGFTGLIRK